MLTAKWSTRTHAFKKREEHLMMHEVTLCGRWFETLDDFAKGLRPAPGNDSANSMSCEPGIMWMKWIARDARTPLKEKRRTRDERR